MQKLSTLASLCVLTLVMTACGDSNNGVGGNDTGTDTADTDGSGQDAGMDTGEDVGSDGDGGSDADADVVEDTAPDVVQTDDLACTAEAVSGDVTPAGGAILELPIDNTVTIGLSTEFRGREVTGATTVSLGCADDIVPDGFTALSPAFSVTADPDIRRFERRYFVSLPFDKRLFPDNARPSAIRVLFRAPGSDETIQPVVVNLQENMVRGNVRFETELTGTFQLAVSDEAGSTYDREWNFRAVTGVSMGASGSSMLGIRHLDEFDIIGPLGGPTDWVYLTHYIRDGGLGGFGTAPEFDDGAPFTPTEEYEHNMSYDNWYFPAGDGTGGSFNRSDYTQIFLDLSLSFGNIAVYNDESPFPVPGLPLEELQRPFDERCPGGDETFTIDTGFFDNEFNPDGSRPVIAFCDGTGNRDRDIEFERACDIDGTPGPDEANEGLYTDPTVQRVPVVISFAVDLDGDGLRDPGEPVIRNFWEPYEDLGSDGVASADEEGYDPVSNPDPAGDDYDYITNPFGTEGNWLHDEGEPYDDFGLDGVDDTPQLDEDGYDFGEGNGEFDYNPNLARMLEERAQRLVIADATQEQLDNTTFYMDAGVRDLFNFAVATNQLVGTINGLGENVRVYDQFYAVEDLPEDDADLYNFNLVDYENVGEHVYIRYGSLDADEEDICFGDGKHVGTVSQIANRLLTMLGFTLNRFPDGDYTTIAPPYPLPNGTYYAPTDTGEFIKYSVVLPPGYEWTQCSDGLDNDGDGRRDGDDFDCTSAEQTSEDPDLNLTRCTDTIDNDEDGLVDADDPDCVNGDGQSEWPMDSPYRNATFPVVYLMHGYGQTPDELQVTALPFAGFMAGGSWAKAIVVYPDGFCGDVEVTQCGDGIDNDGDGDIDLADGNCEARSNRSESGNFVAYCNDGVDNDRDGLTDLDDRGCTTAEWDDEANCVQGNFYTNHEAYLDGTTPGPQYEDQFFDLIDHIDSTYRVRQPETFEEIRD